ncbi:MAG TPA: chorismate mutase [Pseudobdellovibrionaceae bacterium]|nr:chorismate mutase [Pseudobdellovibrionaceae bacterium]
MKAINKKVQKKNSLSLCRKEIEEIDLLILKQMERRRKVIEKIAQFKAKNKISILDLNREKKLLALLKRKKPKELPEKWVIEYLKLALRLSKLTQYSYRDAICD